VSVLEIAFFSFCALFVLGGAVVTIAARRAVRSAMGLLGAIVGVAGCYLMLSAEFLAAVQLIVYAGAVVVLFIFVVMLLGAAGQNPGQLGAVVPRYVGAGTLLLAGAGALGLMLELAWDWAPVLPRLPQGFGEIEGLGRELFTATIVPFELTGVLLLVAAVGALAVARGKQPDPTRLSEPTPAPTDPSSEPKSREGSEAAS